VSGTTERGEVRFLDTTFRDGSQSLWAMGIRHGMMEALGGDLDRAGFDVIEVPANPIFFKKMVRDLKEDPWETMRMLARTITRTPKTCMGGAGGSLNGFGTPTPSVLNRLYSRRLAEIGVLNRAQLMANTGDQITRMLPTAVPFARELGLKVAIAVAYTISPRHTDEHFAETTRRCTQFRPDAIYLKDQGGLLTVDRLRTLLPAMLEAAGDIPVELHSHCTTGLAPLVYLEALELGVRTVHCGVPPLANGSAQPSVLEVARNARLMGFTPLVDEELLASVSRRLAGFAAADGLPSGVPLPHDLDHYRHQIPGGVISNLRHQLAEIRMDHRLAEVLEECVQVRADLGYPIMITPYSQYVATQAALNVASGERYGVVIDELIRLARGFYGEDSGYTWMDENLRDRFLSLPRARELEELDRRASDDMTLAEARQVFGAPGISDDELLLRAIVQGTGEIDTMRAAGPPRRYSGAGLPLLTLVERLRETSAIRYVRVQRGSDSVLVSNRAATTGGDHRGQLT
jgi:oxaloacetate decarboxylase (Na+ extruding) subunit alpha